MTIDEYYDGAVPRGESIPSEITRAFEELNENLLRISERMNNLEDRIEALE